MKKTLALLLAASMSVSMLTGCGSNESQEAADTTAAAASQEAAPSETGEAAAGSVNLRIMMAMGEWTDNIDPLIEEYIRQNPQIGSIEYEFPSSSTYWDLLKGYVSADTIPDIIGMYMGDTLVNWKDYLADLSDTKAASMLSEEERALCSADGGETVQLLPTAGQGWGILYNMDHLKKAGWDRTPESLDELEQLCKDLEAVGIQPFINHYAETSLSLTNHLGSTWVTCKEDPFGFFEELKSGKDMDLVNDPELNAMLDYYDLVLQYCNEDAIATDKWTARNKFFLEEAAMIDDEGSWEMPNIMDVNPALADHVVQGMVPIMRDASKNKLQITSICAAVYKDSPNLEEAKKFLDWFCQSSEAIQWHQDVMGSTPGMDAISVSEGLPCIGKDVADHMAAGKSAQCMTPWTPDEVKDSIGEVWALYLGRQIDREQFCNQYAEIWKNYAATK